jgi:hypothetical protein
MDMSRKGRGGARGVIRCVEKGVVGARAWDVL